MNVLKINHLAALVCIVILHALGFLWYGMLFNVQWMSMVGLDIATMQANAPGGEVWVLNLVSIVAPVYVLAWLFTRLNVSSGMSGAGIAFLITFCFHHLATMNSNMFAKAPFGLAWITAGYMVVGLTISGFILGAWTKKAP